MTKKPIRPIIIWKKASSIKNVKYQNDHTPSAYFLSHNFDLKMDKNIEEFSMLLFGCFSWFKFLCLALDMKEKFKESHESRDK